MRIPGGISRPKLDRPAKQGNARFGIARHGGNDPLQRERRRLIGERGKDVGADPARLVQALGLGGGLRPPERLFDRFAIDGRLWGSNSRGPNLL